MAPMPQNELLTLKAIWDAWEAGQENWDSIGISMSVLGSECDRQIWNDFRWVSPAEVFTGQKLRLFQTGHQQEARLIEDLKRVKGVEVWDTDPERPGKQFKVYSHGGHMRGKLDGIAVGLPDAPTTPHVVECKSHNKKNFDALVKSRDLRKSKLAHWYQCQKYMQLVNLDRCLYMAVGKDNDDLYLERIEYDAVEMAQLDARIEKIIGYNRPPSRVAESPEKYPCILCRHKDVCHGYEFGRNHCRTCVHSTPVITASNDAVWTCEKHKKQLTVEEQRAGCEFHLYLPDVVPGEQFDSGDDWVAYKMRNGTQWVDQEKKPPTAPEQVSVCEVCGGSKIEQIDGGNGNVFEAPCSRCQQQHDLYKTGDKDAPKEIQDRNGHVVLQCCRRCGKAEREIVHGQPCTPVRYWFHDETGELWTTEDGSDPRLSAGADAGHIDELTREDYEQGCVWKSEKEIKSQLGEESHSLNADGICEKCLAGGKELTTHCPNHELTFDQAAYVQNRALDYKDGQWIELIPDSKVEIVGKAEAAE